MGNNKIIGDYGEGLACNYLIQNEYKILCRNYRTRFGEIDIIALKGKVLHIFEVKSRYSLKFGFPSECINKIKMQNIITTTQQYIYEYKFFKTNVEFDLIEIVLNYDNDNFIINHIKNIF